MPLTNSSNKLPNKLANETSPYLIQHALNLVNWYPWGTEAIELARKQDKPILLSIGYAACHWCHVMMHESFCDPEIAATMNRLFINIKVDKQQRPDLDKIYQTTFQLLMGYGAGWPLTMFLSPTTLIPYFGGTYFPKKNQDNLADFATILNRLNDVYYHSKEQLHAQEAHTLMILQILTHLRPASLTPNVAELLEQTDLVLQQEFDPTHGGFGQQEKFPNCPTLDFILDSDNPMTRHIVLTTLNYMAAGGIYDQLGSGFFRYTIDPAWQIPHFEKMLYDNAQLLGIYTRAYKITHNDQYKEIALSTANWLATTLLDPNTGGFFTAVDADSEDQEGLYYLWDLAEIKNTITHEEFASIKKYYNLDHKANFEHKWHLSVNPNAIPPEINTLALIKQKLLEKRKQRVALNIDTTILTSSNGLAIKNFSIAGQILQRPDFLAIADNAINFIQQKLYLSDNLYAFWPYEPKILAFLDDYAFLLDGILQFINDDATHPYIQFCIKLADNLLENFYDSEHGGFFFTSHYNKHLEEQLAEQLFYRPKTFADEAIPSGNGIACLALLKLGTLLGEDRYLLTAKKCIQAAQVYINDTPELHLNLLKAYIRLYTKTP